MDFDDQTPSPNCESADENKADLQKDSSESTSKIKQILQSISTISGSSSAEDDDSPPIFDSTNKQMNRNHIGTWNPDNGHTVRRRRKLPEIPKNKCKCDHFILL